MLSRNVYHFSEPLGTYGYWISHDFRPTSGSSPLLKVSLAADVTQRYEGLVKDFLFPFLCILLLVNCLKLLLLKINKQTKPINGCEPITVLSTACNKQRLTPIELAFTRRMTLTNMAPGRMSVRANRVRLG